MTHARFHPICTPAEISKFWLRELLGFGGGGGKGLLVAHETAIGDTPAAIGPLASRGQLELQDSPP